MTFDQGQQLTSIYRISWGLDVNAFSAQQQQKKSPIDLDLDNFLGVEFECVFITKGTIATEKVSFSTFFSFKSLGDQNLPCHKIDQGQPRVIIYIYLKELTLQVLHTKFQGNQPSGSGKEDFLRFLPYMGMAAILVM